MLWNIENITIKGLEMNQTSALSKPLEVALPLNKFDREEKLEEWDKETK